MDKRHPADPVLEDTVPAFVEARARNLAVVGPSVAKTSCSWEELCKQRAQADYHAAVKKSGGYKPTGDREGHDESTIRARCYDPRLDVHLKHVYAGLSREGLYALATSLMNFGDEQGARRVG